jgi:hypothetical protein
MKMKVKPLLKACGSVDRNSDKVPRKKDLYKLVDTISTDASMGKLFQNLYRVGHAMMMASCRYNVAIFALSNPKWFAEKVHVCHMYMYAIPLVQYHG